MLSVLFGSQTSSLNCSNSVTNTLEKAAKPTILFRYLSLLDLCGLSPNEKNEGERFKFLIENPNMSHPEGRPEFLLPVFEGKEKRKREMTKSN